LLLIFHNITRSWLLSFPGFRFFLFYGATVIVWDEWPGWPSQSFLNSTASTRPQNVEFIYTLTPTTFFERITALANTMWTSIKFLLHSRQSSKRQFRILWLVHFHGSLVADVIMIDGSKKQNRHLDFEVQILLLFYAVNIFPGWRVLSNSAKTIHNSAKNTAASHRCRSFIGAHTRELVLNLVINIQNTLAPGTLFQELRFPSP